MRGFRTDRASAVFLGCALSFFSLAAGSRSRLARADESISGSRALPPSAGATLAKVVGESAPFSFRRWSSRLGTSDLSVVWEGAASDFVAEIVPGSVEWVRVGALTLPRVKVRLRAEGLSQTASLKGVTQIPFGVGTVDVFGTTRELQPGANDLLVPVLSHSDAAVTLTRAEGSVSRFWIRIDRRFERAIDPTCNSGRPAFENLPATGFLSMGCRTVLTREGDRTVPLVEVETASSLAASGGALSKHWLSTGNRSFHLAGAGSSGAPGVSLSVPARADPLAFGLGIGPYRYDVDDGSSRERKWIALPTLYGAYTFRENLRLVTFGALAIHKRWNVDYGLYLWIEQFRGIDDRISLNLLIGARALVFRSERATYSRFSVPQGLELVWREFLSRGHSLTLGAFLYPSTDTRAYTNLWLRFGRPGLFGEVNYIHWYEALSRGNAFRTNALGLSVGFPIGSRP